MKKFAAIMMIAVASTGALVGCSTGKEESKVEQTQGVEKAPLTDLLSQMVEEGAVAMPMEIDETLAKDAYFIDAEILEEYALTETGRQPGIGLIVMVKAKDGQVDAAKANMEKLKEAKIGLAFYPDEQDAAKNAEILVDGNYVALINVHEEVKDTVVNLFKDSTK